MASELHRMKSREAGGPIDPTGPYRIGDVRVKLDIDPETIRAFTKDMDAAFADLTAAMARYGESLVQLTPPITAAFTPIMQAAALIEREQIEAQLRQAIDDGTPASLVDLKFSDDFYKAIGAWGAIEDPGSLDPDERWEYQKWVFAAPLRWWQELRWWVESRLERDDE